MPRSAKCRRVCAEPHSRIFSSQSGEYIILTVEEFEALRLCDFEDLEQDAAAKRMEISRGTFQRILYAARKQVATALTTGKGLRIEGGNYTVSSEYCQCNKQCSNCPFHNKPTNKKEEM